jgi:RES domain-containing protein
MELDRALVRALDRIEPATFAGDVLRHHAPRYSALDGQGARANGGRWNPPGSFSVIYTALDRATVDAEFGRLSRRIGLPAGSFLPRRLTTIRVSLGTVLDLTDARVRRRVGVTLAALTDDDWTRTQQIGLAAQFLGFEGILAPGADGGTTLAIFNDGLRNASKVSRLRDVAYVPPTAHKGEVTEGSLATATP